MLSCKSEGVFAIKFSSSKIWHAFRREQKERSAPLNSRALGACGVWAVTERPCPAGCPGGCAGCRGCFGTGQPAFVLCSSMPSQSRSLGCEPDKNSSCWHHLRRGAVPRRERVLLPKLLSISSATAAWKVLAPSRKHPAFSSSRLLKSTSSKESKCEPFTA